MSTSITVAEKARQNLLKALEERTNWGRNQLKEVVNEAYLTAYDEVLGELEAEVAETKPELRMK